MINRNNIFQENKLEVANLIRNEGSFLLMNKPIGWSSFDVVKKIRVHFKVSKVGHAGTLDPLATGLLIVATGNMTKQIEQFTNLHKEYKGELVLGAQTPSYDCETEIVEEKDYSHLTDDDIRKVFSEFVGVSLQKPPIYSAVKVRGKPLYKYAREGNDVSLLEREIQITHLELMEINIPVVKFSIVCSKGTYVRSLVNDIGNRLGCGAYLKSLTRTKIGSFSLSDAIEIEDLKKISA